MGDEIERLLLRNIGAGTMRKRGIPITLAGIIGKYAYKHIYIYVYIDIERERVSESEQKGMWK